MSNPGKAKIGYALGGGGARGAAHIGVLKALEQHGVFPDLIAGTSAGALVGALYARGLKPADIEKLALQLNWRGLGRFADLTVPRSGLLQGKRIMSHLTSILGAIKFSDLKLPFVCVATDIMTGEEVLLSDGPVVDAVRASISVPGLMIPVRLGGRYLVDGGLVNQVPARTCRQMGAEYVIAVSVSPNPASVSLRRKAVRSETDESRHKAPGLVKVLLQVSLISGYQQDMRDLECSDLAITPSVDDIGLFDFNRAAQAIAIGEEAARRALERCRLPSGGRRGRE
ncbi:MAG: patatin-like phospholipase family protein [Dehalococcoidia bacterium]|nr:patatin-like phospholipase family protein [Dehalococcoidia bacterium]